MILINTRIMKTTLLLFLSLLIFAKLNAQTPQGVIVSDTANITVIKVWGTHYERGYASGYLLADEIKDVYENYIIPAFGTSLALAKSIVSTNAHLKTDSIYIEEAKGMIQGIADAGVVISGVDYLDIIVANTFLDLENLGSKFPELDLKNGCSSLISWGDATQNTSLNGKSVMSRHVDWSTNYALINNQVIVVHFPDEVNEQAWLSIGFAGQISVLSGLNNSGIGVMQHMLSDEYSSGSLNMSYEPIWFCLRKSLEQSDYNQDGFQDVRDVKAAINSNPQGYADSYIVTSIAPASCGEDSLISMIAEVSPASPLLSFRDNKYLDSIPGDNLYAANYSIVRNNAMHFCIRYDSVRLNMGNGTNIDEDENWRIMRDYSSSCAFGGTGNIQFMQYIPENRILKIAVHQSNGTQACATDSIVFDLNVLFQHPPVSISENKTEDEIDIYPNPFNNELHINFGDMNLDNAEIKIYSLSGNIVYQNQTLQSQKLQLEILNKGVFIVYVLDGDQNRFIYKIVNL